MITRSVLVEREDKKRNHLYSSSGLLLNDKFVLVTSNVFASLFDDDTIRKHVDGWQPGTIIYNPLPSEFGINVNVIYPEGESTGLLTFHDNVKIVACFICPNLIRSASALKDFAIDSIENRTDIGKIFSLFFVLNIDEDHTTVTDLEETLHRWFDLVKNIDINKGDSICAKSVPFGQRQFLESYSQGIVSNIVGPKGCLILSDCPSTPGSEGSPCYRKLNHGGLNIPLGIIIASVSWWRGEWIGLTLIADVRPLIFQIISHISPTIRFLRSQCDIDTKHIHYGLLSSVESSLFQIYSGRTSWGTAILLDKSKGIFLTNSHVITNNLIKLRWREQTFPAELIYKTPNAEPYDLAVMKCGVDKIIHLDVKSIKVAKVSSKVGDRVYAAGYGLLPGNNGPTLTAGHLSHNTPYMLKTTCGIHAGSSGGAILNTEGALMGIIVSNTRLLDTGSVYPRCNMAIPYNVVSSTIAQYQKIQDEKLLENLYSNNSEVRKMWLGLEGKL